MSNFIGLRSIKGTKQRTKVACSDGTVVTVHGRVSAADYASGKVETALTALAAKVKVTVKLPPIPTAGDTETSATDEFAGDDAAAVVRMAYESEQTAPPAPEPAKPATKPATKPNRKNANPADQPSATPEHAAESNGQSAQ